MNCDFQIASAKDVARYFVFCEKNFKTYPQITVLLKNISAKSVYYKYRAIFDKLFQMANKHGINIQRYISFFIFELGMNRKNIEEDLLSVRTLNRYVSKMETIANHKKIYGFLIKSVNNIVDKCLENNFSDCREYLVKIIKANLLAEKFISGEISQYYLASIKNIDKIIAKMDTINKNELQRLVSRREKLNMDTQTAFQKIAKESFNPIEFTNKLLTEKSKQFKHQHATTIKDTTSCVLS